MVHWSLLREADLASRCGPHLGAHSTWILTWCIVSHVSGSLVFLDLQFVADFFQPYASVQHPRSPNPRHTHGTYSRAPWRPCNEWFRIRTVSLFSQVWITITLRGWGGENLKEHWNETWIRKKMKSILLTTLERNNSCSLWLSTGFNLSLQTQNHTGVGKRHRRWWWCWILLQSRVAPC